jgi:hypothetical protein
MLRFKDKDKMMGRFQRSLHSNSTKKHLAMGVQTPNNNHIKIAQKKNFRSSKKTNKMSIENNSSVISINTLIKSSQNDVTKPKIKGVGTKELVKPLFMKKKNSGSILKHKKNKYEPSKLLNYYSRSSFQKV